MISGIESDSMSGIMFSRSKGSLLVWGIVLFVFFPNAVVKSFILI